jgi:flagellar basal body rod protein FlgC
MRAERAVDASATMLARALVPSEAASVVSALGPSDPLDGASGDVVEPMIQRIAAQRAFTASLAVLRTGDEMQRALVALAR